MKVDQARDDLVPKLDWIKAEIFDHDPDEPIVFHRTEILGGKGPFEILREKSAKYDAKKHAKFNRAILRVMDSAQYVVITALIDKYWMTRQDHWERKHPYHYLMEIIVEKYVQYLERMNDIGDIMPESRQRSDKSLQKSFDEVLESGTDYVAVERIASAIRAKNLKFRTKKQNIAGLQLCDLIAHPSHIFIRGRMGHNVNLGPYATQVADILWRKKYDRSYRGDVGGYGIKHLPR